MVVLQAMRDPQVRPVAGMFRAQSARGLNDYLVDPSCLRTSEIGPP